VRQYKEVNPYHGKMYGDEIACSGGLPRFSVNQQQKAAKTSD